MVMLAHGKCTEHTRAQILNAFLDKLKATTTSPLPAFRRLEIALEEQQQQETKPKKVDEIALPAGSEAPSFTEHVITADVLREAGLDEGQLLRQAEEK